jgi:hypothetical protein
MSGRPVDVRNDHNDQHKPGENAVAEVLVQFADPVVDENGRAYVARAVGAEMPDSRWQGWIEFLPVDGGKPIRSGRETTQPNRVDTEYWATGLRGVYLEGALERALNPYRPAPEPTIPPPAFDGPADPDEHDEEGDEAPETATRSILDPFSVYRKGETLLRNQLGALSAWHLVNIIRAHSLSSLDPAALKGLPPSALIEIIVEGVRAAVTQPAASSRSSPTGLRDAVRAPRRER